MNKGLYGRLALSNLEKNGKIYLPYLLTCIGTVMMFYLMQFLYTNPWVKTHASLMMVLGMGCVVVGLFAFIFLFYTNSFLMKQRKKEMICSISDLGISGRAGVNPALTVKNTTILFFGTTKSPSSVLRSS